MFNFRGIYTAFSYILFISLIISYVTEPGQPYAFIIGTFVINPEVHFELEHGPILYPDFELVNGLNINLNFDHDSNLSM